MRTVVTRTAARAFLFGLLTTLALYATAPVVLAGEPTDEEMWAVFPKADEPPGVNAQLMNDTVSKGETTKTYDRRWTSGSRSMGLGLVITVYADEAAAKSTVAGQGEGNEFLKIDVGDWGYRTTSQTRPYYCVRKGRYVLTATAHYARRGICPDLTPILIKMISLLPGASSPPDDPKTHNISVLVTVDATDQKYQIAKKRLSFADPDGPTSVTASGKVTDKYTGKAVANAKVYVEISGKEIVGEFTTRSTTSDAQGMYGVIVPNSAGKGKPKSFTSVDMALEGNVPVEIEVVDPNQQYQSDRHTYRYPAVGQPGLILISGFVKDKQTNQPLEGLTVRVVQGTPKSPPATTDAKGFYEVLVQPNLFDPSRPRITEPKDFLLERSGGLTAELNFWQGDRRMEGDRARMLLANGQRVRGDIKLLLGGKPLKNATYHIEFDSVLRRGGQPIGYVVQSYSWGGQDTTSANGLDSFVFDQPKLASKGGSGSGEFPVQGTFIVRHTTAQGVELSTKIECPVFDTSPQIKLVVDKNLVDAGTLQSAASPSTLTITDYDSKRVQLWLRGNGSINFPDTHGITEFQGGVKDMPVDLTGEFPSGGEIRFLYRPATKRMDVKQYLAQSGITGPKLLETFLNSGATVAGHEDSLDTIGKLIQQSPELANRISKVHGDRVASFLKKISIGGGTYVQKAPGIFGTIVSGANFYITYQDVTDRLSDPVIIKLDRSGLQDNTDLLVAMGDLFVAGVDVGVNSVGLVKGVSLPLTIAWELDKAVWNYVKYVAQSEAAYLRLLEDYEAMAHEPISVVVRDQEGHEVRDSQPVTIRILRPKK